jgi:arginine exporter protein ArgO
MSTGILVPAAAGFAAGLGVAMPLGAIGAMILREGLVDSFRRAAAAAAGVASVDTAYCAVAMLSGAAVAPAIRSHRGMFLLISGALLVAMGTRQLVAAKERRTVGPFDSRPSSLTSTYARFVGLTAINPLTLLYFVALAGAVTTTDSGPVGPIAFVIAAGTASLAWQLLLALVGSAFGKALSARAATRIGVLASLLVIGLGFGVVLSALSLS